MASSIESPAENARRPMRRAMRRAARAMLPAMALALASMATAGAGDAADAAAPAPARRESPESGRAAAVPPSGNANEQGLSALLAGMRSTSGVIADFTETRELALLSSPLESTGTIWFLPPSRLVRLVSSPGRSRLVVDGDKVRFESDTGSQALDLSSSPIARQIVDSFVVLFNGDEKRLRELYDATFDAGAAAGGNWHLHLSPRSAPLNRMIASFDMYGSERRIDRMESVEPDGDRTVTRFGRTETAHVFTAGEIEQLFAASPSR